MKRTMHTAVLLGLFASVGMAVESVNTVGYTTVDVASGGFTLFGVQFQEISGSGTINIQDVVDTSGLVGFDWVSFTGGDQLLIWNPAVQGYAQQYTWVDADPYFMVGAVDVWVDPGTFAPVTVDLDVGSAFWISSSGTGATATHAGEVPADPTGVSSTLYEGFTLLSNPYPTALNINTDVTYTGLAGFDWVSFTGGDQLLLWDPTSQGYAQQYTWVDADPYFMVGAVNVWVDPGTFAPVDVSVPVGGAFWVQKTTAAAGNVQY